MRSRLYLLAALGAALAALISASAHHGRGAAITPTGLQITTASLSNVTVGATTSQTLSISGNAGAYACNQVSASPNTALWVYITPNCTVSGTPQMAETETVIEQVTDSVGNVAQKTFTFNTVASGALAFVTTTTLTNLSKSGAYNYQNIASGGQPPYIYSTDNAAQPCTLTWMGWIECGGATSNQSIDVTVTDSIGTQVMQTETITADTTLRIRGVDSTDGLIHLPPTSVGKSYMASIASDGGSGSGYYCTATSGLPAWAAIRTNSAGVCIISGIPNTSGAFEVALKVTDSSANTATATTLTQVGSSAFVSRPAYNSASGFFVLNGQLYDGSGAPFRIRGLNQLHYNSSASSGIPNTAANTVRIWDGNCTASIYTGLISTYAAAGIFSIADLASIPTNATTCSGTATNTSTASTDLTKIVSWWVANEGAFLPYMNEMALNVANEWGPGASIQWQYDFQAESATATSTSGASNSVITVNTGGGANPFQNSPLGYISGGCGATATVFNITAVGGTSGAWTITTDAALGTHASGCTVVGGAVGVLRAAGYTCPIAIDAGGVGGAGPGQDFTNLLTYASTVQASDPMQNTIETLHAYNNLTNTYGVVSSVTTGASTTILTLNATGLAYNPMNPPATGTNPYSGISSYFISGAAGGTFTNLNGLKSSPTNTYGSAPNWQLHLNLDSSAYTGAYSANTASVIAAGTSSSSNVAQYNYILGQLAALRSSNTMILIGEFGPGARSGDPTSLCCDSDPTPTQIGQVISAAEANQIGWVEWAMDDNNLTGNAASWSAVDYGTACTASTCWFGDTGLNGANGRYSALTDLTAPGLDIILNSRYGLGALASPASSLGTTGQFTQGSIQIIGQGSTTAFYLDRLNKPCGVGMKASGVYPVSPLNSWTGTITTNGTTTITPVTTSTGDIGPGTVIVAADVPAGTTVVSGTPDGNFFVMNNAATGSHSAETASGNAPPLIPFNGTFTTTSGSSTVTVVSQNGTVYPGNEITGVSISSIPVNTTILPYGTNGTTGTGTGTGVTYAMSANATASASGTISSGWPAWYTMGDTPDADPLDPTVCTETQWAAKWGWTDPTTSGNEAANNNAIKTFLQDEKNFTNTGAIWYISKASGNDATCAVNRPDLPCLTSAPVLVGLEGATTASFSGVGSFTTGSNVLTITAYTSGALATGMMSVASAGMPAKSFYIRGQLAQTTGAGCSTGPGQCGTYALNQVATSIHSGVTITGYHYNGGAIIIEGGNYAVTDLNFTPFYTYPNGSKNIGFYLTGSFGYPLYVLGFPGNPPTLQAGINQAIAYEPLTAACCLTFDGLKFWTPFWDQDQSGSLASIEVNNSSNITIINNEFAGDDKAFFGGDAIHNVTIQNNVVHDTNAHAFYMGFGTDCGVNANYLAGTLTTPGVDTNFVNDAANYLNLTSCGASSNFNVVGNVVYDGAYAQSAGGDVFHINTWLNGGLIQYNIVSYSGVVAGLQTGIYNLVVDSNIFFDNGAAECFQEYLYGNGLGQATVPATSTSLTMNSIVVGGHQFSVGYKIVGQANFPQGDTITAIPAGGGTGAYTLATASLNTGSYTGPVMAGLDDLGPSTMNNNSFTNNICWQPATNHVIDGGQPANGFTPLDNTDLSYIKNTIFTNNIVVTSGNANNVAAFWFRQNSYPATDTITGNTLFNTGTSTSFMVVDPNSDPSNTIPSGNYTFSQFAAKFPGNTNANPGFAAASDALVQTPGAFNFAPNNLKH